MVPNQRFGHICVVAKSFDWAFGYIRYINVKEIWIVAKRKENYLSSALFFYINRLAINKKYEYP
tara:strand:+ start:411 stop:602 length:192 start_codon:yes stop_codon:yes gene_type:complete